MQFRKLREEVVRVNQEIVRAGLVVLTWGNASAADRAAGVMAIKPSGVDYARLKPEDIVVLALADGRVVAGKLRPSSDTPTHLHLYQQFKSIGGIVHTHSLQATAWAQARREIPALGTTHADYWHGPVPCTRPMTADEIRDNYEVNTGQVIVERFANLDPLQRPGVLVASHGPWTWGRTVAEAVDHAVVLEFLARLASATLRIQPTEEILPALLDKHFLRKHGPGAYYGQTTENS